MLFNRAGKRADANDFVVDLDHLSDRSCGPLADHTTDPAIVKDRLALWDPGPRNLSFANRPVPVER